ncbi:PAS domain S-box protein [Paracidovorax sp. MALMAid1276]|uniref:PAS domain S-box protein n=1 Tax=Paracidovorax sp. MALMAid1276 TaxID=3411631 RepID=UPI003B99BCAB
MIDRFFLVGAEQLALDVYWSHDPWLVAVSVAVAIATSIMALHLAGMAQRADDASSRRLIILSGSVALGGGVWSMHFVGMLAFPLCASGDFNPWITMGSVIPSLLASWVALNVLAQARVTGRSLLISGALVGAGIGVMHYSGMAASQFAPVMRYDVAGFLASLVFAVSVACLALWVHFRLARVDRLSRWVAASLGGAVMGLAIAGMHYIAMAAVRVVAPAAEATGTSAHAGYLALGIALVTLAMGGVITGVNVTIRFSQLLRESRATASRLSALVDTAVDGIVIIDARGTVRLFNGAAQRLLGWSAQEVLGQNIRMLMPQPHRDAHDSYLRNHIATGVAKIIGAGREVDAVRKDGTLVPIRLAVGRVEQPGEPLFVGFLTDLTERRALERERRQGEEQLRSLVGNLPGVAFRCLNGGSWPMLFISDAVVHLTGWTADDFVAGRIHFGDIIHPDDAAHIALDVEHALRHARPYHVEYRITTRDGHTRWMSENGRGVPDADGSVRWIDGVILDVTDSKARNAEFEGIVQAIGRSQATVEFDLLGRVVAANPNFLALTGYTLDEIIGQPHALFCGPDFVQSDDYATFWRQLGRGEFIAGEFERVGKDGRKVWLHATYNPILDADGKVVKIMKFATDLSQRRAMERDLRTAKDRAEQAAAARSTFLANMSHEIRTPMNAIIGFTEALLESPLESTQRRHLGTVHHAARSMLRLLNDILDTAKLEKGAVELEIEPFSLRELCDQILASLRINAAKKGLTLALDYAPTVAEFWQGDAFRIQQVLLNLIGNAIKFTHEGRITLRVSGTSGDLLFDVIDTGIGIDAAGLQRIFDPFSQADASTTRRYGGTGLGTTIARQLTELMGGHIAVASQVGHGSTFSVHLPLPTATGPDAGATPAAGGRTRPRMALPPLRVLAVDDVPANLELLDITLQRGGHKVVLAHSGADAVKAFEHERFDLVLMDLQMPDMDGLEATRHLRNFEQAQQRSKPVAIVALSASVLERDRRNARAAGMDGFASKPIEPLRLMGEIARVIGLRGLADDALPITGSVPLATDAAPLGADAAQARSATHERPAIDWERGVRLWTQARYLREAIARFLQDADTTLDALRAAVAAGDTEALAAAAHRLRGAAANLALATVQRLAERLEAAAAHPAHAAARPVLVDELAAALHQVQLALGSLDAPDAVPATAASAPAPMSAGARAQVLAALDAMARALATGELPDGPLGVLEQHLPATSLNGLREALDRFDFDDAQGAVRALQAHIGQMPAPTEH